MSSVDSAVTLTELIKHAVIIKPGQKVLIGLSNRPSSKQCKEMITTLETVFPDVSFAIVGECTSIAVQEESVDE